MPPKTIENALAYWRRNGVSLLPPSNADRVIDRLTDTGRLLSRDVIDLYLTTGGMASGQSDSHFFTLWNLDEVVEGNRRHAGADLLFADFLINSHCYCFHYESDERSSVWIEYFGGIENIEVADSVNRFFELVIRDPEKLGLFTDSE